MNAIDLPRYSPNVPSFPSKLIPILLLLFFLMAAVLRSNAQSANLDQGSNGSSTAPTSPVDWVNGNLNNNQAHFLEGYSVPYRAVLTNLVANKTYTLVIGLDITASGKHALDYITQFQRLEPHGIFLHAAETVNPLLNITGFPESYFTSTSTLPIPAPSSAGSPVAGQPTTSFNALPASERVMTGYNATLNSLIYASEGSLTGSNSETVINITFTALKETVVLAWGGHIASVLDWGKDASGQTNSASSINGSPYHMRLKNWIIDGNVISIGNQDRSLKTNAVYIPPEGSISGPSAGCIETTSLNYTSTVDDPTGLTYLWSIIGSNTANAKIVNNTLANIQVVPIGTTFTAGSFSLQLIVTRNGLADTSYLGSDVYPGQLITLSKVMVNAGADQSITNLDTAYLSASASGGVPPYTFSWSPVTGLSNPNIFNPQFIPTGTGTFQFVVTATDSAGCVGKDTVVITVTQHPAPPCIINGPNPVCPGSSNVYMGPLPSQVGSYSWSITGDGSITGAMSNDTVTVMAGNTCGSYTLQLITTTSDGKVKDTCSLMVNVKDTIAPVLSGTAPDASITCAKDLPAAPVITATDNCIGNVQVQMSQQTIDSTCVNKFKLVRKWWAVDACGNTSDTLTQTITVNDNVKPVIAADFPKDVKVQCVSDIPAPPAPTATDNCDALVTPIYDEIGSGTACDSTIVRTWIFADACGNSDSVKQTIHIKDSIAPVLAGTAPDAAITCAKDIPAAPVITASDNCTANVTVQMSQMTTDSTCVNKFKLVRKWWAVDACGNTSDTLKQTITVNDNVKPVITADFPADVKVQCVKDIPALPTPTATDNCDASVIPAYSEAGSGSACDSTIVRTWIFADACGNSDSVKQTIHIKDSIAPVLSGTAPDAAITCAKDIPAPPAITASDNCTANVAVQMKQYTTDSTCVNKFKLVRKWWAVDACGNSSDTLKQTITVNDNVKPVITATFTTDVNIQCLKDIPPVPAPTATDNCDAAVTPVYSQIGSGTSCDSTIVRTWIFADVCGNSDSVKQTIHIKNNVVPVLSGTVTDLVVACAKDIPSPQTITASGSCSGATVYFSAVTTDSTCVNKFTVVRKWWAVDGCGNKSDTIKQTIIVKDSIAPIVATAQGSDKLISCSVPLAYDAPTFTDNCNGKVTVTTSDRKEGTVCPFKYIRRWTATDECGNSIYVEQAITVSCCVSYCTYTQGFYGNKGGVGCTPGGGSLKAQQMMSQVVDAQPGDSAIFGLKSTGKFFTLFLGDITNSSIFNMLPGGGTAVALKGYATYSKSATWPNVPISTASTTFGKINNVLLSQTMTLFFNMGITPTLSALTIDGDSLFTAKLTTCGSNTPVSQIDAYKLPINVVAYLSSTGQATVQGLFMLANKYLGGQTVSGVSASDVNAAIDAINNGFNNCAVLVRWAKTVTAISNISSVSYDNSGQLNYSKETAPSNLSVTVFPNPYTETILFRYVAPETGKAQLELYDLQGRRVAVVYSGEVTKGSLQLIEYHVPETSRILFIYRLSVGQFNATGKIVPAR
ncbi:putative secreted protein (Por secretion system target) [Chitinophaga polysaccharea]|uniref:Putative secreted protein (Por secretion system target) n=1 Tax=Chitinophaga polysaccharea TaxID=1293035 RepID=A0A561PQV0_9BACT|nr:hypothetical protein [Chitinophaga polysaccharea]TWF40497.1 putative secreted protein (Por secretion system target) [Chitinophaga polysaccharea]